MKKKRKLKPIPKMIFNIIRYTVFGLVAIYLAAYFLCLSVLVNAEQMDARYVAMAQETEVR